MLCAAILATSLIQANRYADTDHDGLLDVWETAGFGPLDPKVHKCDPKRADIIVVFRIRSMMTQALIQPTIDRMAKYYASMPYKNPDGSTGLNLIAVVPPPMAKEFDDKGYTQLYEQMPTEWRGLAHGICVDNSAGGGGQANRPDWCGTGYNWATMLHELGHQLGLPHEPMGAKTGSPFHRSMMNYDYSYQLGGSIENITFSDGKFASMKMKETALNEVFPFAKAEVEFLSNRPYYFKLKELGPKKTAIDWNRNGIFGEAKVRADVNDGYSVGLHEGLRMEKSAGAPALVGLGSELGMVFPTVPDFKDWKLTAPQVDKPAGLSFQWLKAGKAGPVQKLEETGVCGDVSVTSFAGEIWVAYPAAAGYTVVRYAKERDKLVEKLRAQYGTGNLQPTLIPTPDGLIAAVWHKESGAVTLQPLTGERKDAITLPEVISQMPVGGAWNGKTKTLGLCVIVHQLTFDGCIKILPITLGKSLKIGDPLWVGGDKGGARTSSRPIVIFDGSRDRGPNGSYNVYLKGQYPDANQAGVNYCCRQIEDPTMGGGWRVKMMGNEWALSRSVCSAISFQGDIAYAYRWSGGESDHVVLVTRKASGIEDRAVTDFDEVKFIFEKGLQNSLRSVQAEQWKQKH